MAKFLFFLLFFSRLAASHTLYEGVDVVTGELKNTLLHLTCLDEKGRITKILSPRDASKILTAFTYHTEQTIVRDIYGRKTLYDHNGVDVFKITTFEKNGSLYRTEEMEWHEEHGELSLYSLRDGEGDLFLNREAAYNERGQLIHEVITGSSLPESFEAHYRYHDLAPYQMVLREENSGRRLNYLYKPNQTKIAGIILHGYNRRFFDYDAEENLISVTLDNGSSEDPLQLKGISFRKRLVFSPSIQQPERIELYEMDMQTKQEELVKALETPFLKQTNLLLFSDFLEIDSSDIHQEAIPFGSFLSSKEFSLNSLYTGSFGYTTMTGLPKPEVEINDRGQIISSTNDCQLKMRYLYDTFGRLIKVTYPPLMSVDQKVIIPTYTLDYDVANRLSSITDPNGYTTHLIYSPHHKLETIALPDGSKLTPSLSMPAPFRFFNTDPLIPNELAEAEHQLQKTSNVIGQTVWLLVATDSLGTISKIRFNSLGLPEQIEKINVCGRLTQKHSCYYDGTGNQLLDVRHLSSREHQTKWQYGPNNRIEKIIEAYGSPEQQQTQFLFDQEGLPSQIIKPDGISINYTHSDGNLTHVWASDNSVDYRLSYNQKQNPIYIKDGVNQIQSYRQYNRAQQLTKETFHNDLSITKTYNTRGLRHSLHLPDLSYVQYDYDDDGQIHLHRFSKNHELRYSPKIENTTPHWSQELTSINHSPPHQTHQIETKDPGGKNLFSYQFDEEGRLIYETTFKEKEYNYDRLSNQYTPRGDVRSYNEQCQLTMNGNRSYAYDANGNLVRIIASSGTYELQYDALNRMTKVTINDLRSIHYIYDYYGRRIKKIEHEKCNYGWLKKDETLYLYDEQQEIAAYKGNQCQILRILPPPLNLEFVPTAAIETKDNVYTPIHDLQGNIACLIDAETEEPVEYYRYSAFGEEQLFNASGRPMNAIDVINPWRFAGKRKDNETNLIYFGKRYYDPRTARWTSKKHSSLPKGPNLYRYRTYHLSTPKDTPAVSPSWWKAYYFLESLLHQALNLNDQVSQYIEDNISVEPHIKPAIEPLARALFGQTTLVLLGFYEEKPCVAVVGKGELDKKVRVTVINGMFNIFAFAEENAHMISATHGDINVHYVFRPTKGWTEDLIKSTASTYGYSTFEARLLAQTWRRLIQEMGGPGNGGVIIHYAHSIGGAETMLAKQYLNREEQKMIRVISFGSPVVIPHDSFHKTVNYISVRDGILLLSPIAHLAAMVGGGSTVIYLDSYWGIPLIDHLMSCNTYKTLLEQLGKEFLEVFIEKKKTKNTFTELLQ